MQFSTSVMASMALTLSTLSSAAPAPAAANQTEIDAFWDQEGPIGGVSPDGTYGNICNRGIDSSGRCSRAGKCNLFNVAGFSCSNIPGTECIELYSTSQLQNMNVCNKDNCGGKCNSLSRLDWHYDSNSRLYIIPTPGTNSVQNNTP